MKKVKYSALLLALLLCFGVSVNAQVDSRQRTVETVIADGLAQLPAQKPQAYDQVIGEMAATGQKGIESIIGMLQPSDQGKNATFEYAINGIVNYVSAAGKESLREPIRKGIIAGIEKTSDKVNKSFLLTQLGKIATAAEAPVFEKYLSDSYQQQYALSALASMPDNDNIITSLIQNEKAPKSALAYLAYFKKLKGVESNLLGWTNGADEKTLAAVYNALTVCGSDASLKTLQAAAKAKNFADDPTGASDSYFQLLNNYSDNAVVLKQAKQLLKNSNSAVRSAGLRLLLKSDSKNVTKNILSALKDNDIQYRNTALDFAKQYAGDGIFSTVASNLSKLSPAAQTDVVRWLGNNKAKSQIAAVTSVLGSSNEDLVAAGAEAASKIGGNDALTALIGLLGSSNENTQKAANKALLSFNGNIADGVAQALNSSDTKVQTAAMKLASARRIYSAYNKILGLTSSSDNSVKAAAFDALKGVAKSSNFGQICDLMEKASGSEVTNLQAAALSALHAESADQQYSTIASRLAGSSKAALYYPLLAQAGNSSAIKKLLEEYGKAGSKDAAFKSLLSVNNPEMIDVLYNLAKENAGEKDAVISRYVNLVKEAGKSPIQNYLLYSRALALNPSAKVQSSLVSALSSSPTLPSLMEAASYLNKAETAPAAAATVKTIIAKNTDLQKGKAAKDILTKAQSVYQAAKDKGDADAGYAVDEIKGILAQLNTDGGYKSVLTSDATKQFAITSGGVEYSGEHENFELYLEWDATAGDAVLNLRSMPLVKLEAAKGVSYVYSDKAIPATQGWNLIYVKMLNDRIFVEANGEKVVENATIKNVPETKKPLEKGTIELKATGDQVKYQNFYVNDLPDTPIFTLSEEEAKQGFEVLFDGRSLEKWHGNTTAYVPVDGNIYVTANYGGTGNLYTKETYSDFIYRFEFFFDVPAVNNGIGIRTGKGVTGVDAAYEGMEIQVLDHDDPVYQGYPFGYKGLRPYQNHGSVYGVVIPEHVDFGPIKQWHTEEIKAVGDQITVTIDGKVILDANIREACQGHNVAPDGSNTNPYTLDHKNHPGLFNKEGYISFCGHGAGVKFRNVRILDLSKKTAQKGKNKKK